MGSTSSTEDPHNADQFDFDSALWEVSTLAELSALSKSAQFDKCLEHVWGMQQSPEQVEAVENLKTWEAQQKKKFHPEHNHPELKMLKQRAMQALESTTSGDETHRQLVVQIAAERDALQAEFIEYERVMNFVQRKVAVVANKGQGRSNRAKRAGLLSRHAGRSKIQGAETDKHGNAQGTEYDLGVDGAFSEMKIVVLQLYSFPSGYTTKAFQQKGFQFEWITSVPTPAALATLLQPDEVCQLWVISGSGNLITAEHARVIQQFHERGKSLYVWGDNTPFISDANNVLRPLFGSDLEMFGDVPGGKVVHLCENVEEAGQHRGFVEHLITTGLVHLFEGITVASFDEARIRKHDFLPLTWGSAANLVTIYRPSGKTGGAVMCDGAFTRLYCNVDDAGTIRYIINCACWLAVESLGTAPPVFELPEEESCESDENSQYNVEGAFQGQCAILWEPVPMCFLSVLELADPERNTNDFTLNDPLSVGDANVEVVGRQLYGEATGAAVRDIGTDPFLRCPVAGLLPVVSLADKKNRDRFSDELCRVFMGHRKLYGAAQLVFIGTVDSLLAPARQTNYEPQVLEAMEFLLDQALHNFRSTPDFTDVGDKLPVLEAMQHYLTVAPPLVQVSKSFTTVCLMARTLLQRKLVPVPALTLIVRRSLIKFLASSALRFVKADSNGNLNPQLVQMVVDATYQCWNHIPLPDSGHLMAAMPDFVPKVYEAPLRRYEEAAGESVWDDAMVTLLFMKLAKLDLRKYKPESLLETLLRDPAFAAIWDGTLPSASDIVAKLNKRFVQFEASATHRNMDAIPFVTTYGPTVFACARCGTSFGDVTAEPTEEYADMMKKARNLHFKEHLHADGNGYPTATSQHYSLHRTVQLVMINHPGVMEADETLLAEVAERIKDLKGNIYSPTIAQLVADVVESYLVCRRRGEPDPSPYVKFYERYTRERDAAQATLIK